MAVEEEVKAAAEEEGEHGGCRCGDVSKVCI